MVFLNTLYVSSEEAYLNLEGETVVVTLEGKKKLQVPLHHLESMVLLETVRASAPLLSRCIDRGISIVWLRFNGRFGARVEGPTTGNVLLRIAQHDCFRDKDLCCELAREFTRGKLINCRSILMRVARESDREDVISKCQTAAQRVADAQSALDRHQSLDEIRGREGEAAAAYFGAFSWMIKPQQQHSFPFTTRQRRPAPDPLNALLSFAYALLLADCRSALEAVGLDPQLGFLHAVRPGRPSLALDLMEEFRPVLGDRLVLTLVNRSQLTRSDFAFRPGGQVELSDSARKIVIQHYQARKKEELKHPLLKDPVPIGVLPMLQARLLARRIRRDIERYLPYRHH